MSDNVQYVLHCPECDSTNLAPLEPVGGQPGLLCQACGYMADEREFEEEEVREVSQPPDASASISMNTLTEAEALYVVYVLAGIKLAGEFTLTTNLAVPLDPENPGWEHIEPLRSAINGPELLERLERWTPAQREGLIAAVERFWEPGHVADVKARLREVGLVK